MFAAKNELFTSPSGYQISRSVRLRSSASAYFNRTPASATNRRTFTWSGWVKRGSLQTSYNQYFFSATPSVSARDGFIFNTSSGLSVFANDGSGASLATTQVFRDPSAWYHIVVAVDTTQATSTNRIKVYVNGVQVTSFSTSTYPSQNYDWAVNNTVRHTIGDDAANAPTGLYHFDGYLTEINFIDGQALTPTSFGQFNSVTGVWQPLKYTGTYGTNGFYLNFSDNSNNTATTIGKDYSGNGNNWTPNNISVTSGSTYDSMLDVPTPYADGGNGRGNYAVLNPLSSVGPSYHTLYGGNLNWQTNTSVGGSSYNATGMTFSGAPSSGLWYYEFVVNQISAANTGYIYHQLANCYIWWVYGGTYQIVGSNGTTSIGGLSNGDVIQVAVNSTTGNMWYGRNGTWYTVSGTPDPAAGTGASSTFTPTSDPTYFSIQGRTGNAVQDLSFNFGQRPFSYTPPSGFKALNTQNLPAPTISNGALYMAATLYTGNGVNNRAITGVGFQPDLVWTKARSAAYDALITDAVRGSGKSLTPSSTGAEVTNNGNGYVSAFNADGFTLTQGVSSIISVNESGQTYVGWQWKAGNSSSSNTSGSITSTVSVNATAGFSIVTYTGNGTNGATIGHGLGVAPKMVLFKARSSAIGWDVYHASVGNTAALTLNSTGAAYTSSVFFNNTSPTSSVITLGTDANLNGSGTTFVAYCFSAVAGYSAFGSYTGNGSSTDGPFVYLGFRPRWIMVKRTDTSGDSWFIFDSSRNVYNVEDLWLGANLSNAESTNTYGDFLSNGFKVRNTLTGFNTSGGTYIYAAFAENPYKVALAR